MTDTFQMYEREDLVDALLVHNSARRKRQKQLDIKVIIGNPPYSIGQGSQNDNNQNVGYPHLDQRITETYAARSKATLSKGLYDSYIRAIRWASDRIGDSGIIGYVSGSGFIEKPATDGIRKCLAEEFSSIHILNLRGDIRKNMLSKGRAKEGHNIFGSGSMTGIAITLFVKNPAAKSHGQIYYHDIGDELTRDEKLERLQHFSSVTGIGSADAWTAIVPDQHGDWLNQRDDNFAEYIVLGDKKGDSQKLFENFSLGVVTNRDAWCYNASKSAVVTNMKAMIAFYNSETRRFQSNYGSLDKKAKEAAVDGFIDNDPTRISWTRGLKQELLKGRTFEFDERCMTPSLYRPFTKQWLYFNRRFNEMVLQMPRIFPDANAENLVICVTGIGARAGFSAMIADTLPNLHMLDTGQCFPLYLYDDVAETDEAEETHQAGLFGAATGSQERKRREAMTDAGLAHFQAAYARDSITKEDVFYYIYGMLHSEDYRDRYADNLSKELPRIPRVKEAKDFWAFSNAGRQLADLHLNFETVKMYPLSIEGGGLLLSDADFKVEKMRYGKSGKDKDLTTIIYNKKITVTGISLEAYDYIVNGKPALDWVLERQCCKSDKESGMVNDANDWASETMNNPRYPFELLRRVITVSLETMKIVRGLPKLDILTGAADVAMSDPVEVALT